MGGVTSQVCSAPTVCFHRHCSLQAGAPTPKTLINVFGQQQRTPISCCCVWGSAYENGCELNLILHRISEVAGNYHTAVIICSCPSGILAQFEKYGEKRQNVSVHLISFIHIQVAMFVLLKHVYQLSFKCVSDSWNGFVSNVTVFSSWMIVSS